MRDSILCFYFLFLFFFKQKTAYEMRISDWSSDVCSSDLPRFTDETAACMVWSEAIKLMLVTHAKWRMFTSRPIPPSTSSEVALNLSCESRESVAAMNAAAAANGGTADIHPVQEPGPRYGRHMADPDGHTGDSAGRRVGTGGGRTV